VVVEEEEEEVVLPSTTDAPDTLSTAYKSLRASSFEDLNGHGRFLYADVGKLHLPQSSSLSKAKPFSLSMSRLKPGESVSGSPLKHSGSTGSLNFRDESTIFKESSEKADDVQDLFVQSLQHSQLTGINALFNALS
jgi:hypothetical protein